MDIPRNWISWTLKNAPNFFGCWKVKYLWPILCLYFWGPEAMRGNNIKEKKVVPLIFTQFWIRSHLNKLNLLTPQDVYYLDTIWMTLRTKTNLFSQLGFTIYDQGWTAESLLAARKFCIFPLATIVSWNKKFHKKRFHRLWSRWDK